VVRVTAVGTGGVRCLQRHVLAGGIDWLVRELAPGRDVAGPVAVFVPGLGSGEYLLPHARLLARTRRVLVPDMPGFGHSRGPHRLRDVGEHADALLALLRSRDESPADLLGNSVGTQMVLAAAERDHDAVRRIVLIGPTFDRVARSYRKMLGRWLATMPHEPPSLGVSLLRSYAKSGIVTPLVTFRSALLDRPEERLATLPHPVLVVRGSKDRIATDRWLEELTQLSPYAESAVVPGVAHTVDYAAPAALARLTEAFLGRV
jgi:pimeloyl-ACP methyl ester carboxylesterase